MTGKDYRDLLAWNKAFELAIAIYKETSSFPSNEMFGMVSQLRRAAVSVSSNIAEGQGRRFQGEFLRYLHIALGSIAEVETQLLISQKIGYIRLNQTQKLLSMTAEIGKLINGLINSLRNR